MYHDQLHAYIESIERVPVIEARTKQNVQPWKNGINNTRLQSHM